MNGYDCGKEQVDARLLVDAKTRGIANVVIELIDKERPLHPEWKKMIDLPVEMHQGSCQYEPRFCVIFVGQTWKLTNHDAVAHNPKLNTHTNSSLSDTVLPSATIVRRFKSPEPVATSIFCSIHPWMQGYLIIRDHPHIAVTDVAGKFAIRDLPPGKWTFRVWQERSGSITSVRLDGHMERWTKGCFTITINRGENKLGSMQVPASVFDRKK